MHTFEGLYSAIIYLVIYLFSTVAVFYVFIIIRSRQENSISFLEFESFRSLKVVHPTLVFMLVLNLLSMAGIPPLAGFLTKFFLFTAILEEGTLGVAFLLVLVSLFTAYYYIRPVKILLFNPSKTPAFLTELQPFGGLMLIFITFLNLALLLTPKIILILVEIIQTTC